MRVVLHHRLTAKSICLPQHGVEWADLNRDGRLDIVVGYVELPGSVYFNEGQGSFREIAWNDGQGVVYGMAFSDLNGDGWPDIIAARSDAPNGIWFSEKPNNQTRHSQG